MAANTVTRVKPRRKPISNITVPLKSGVALKQGNVAGNVPGTHTCAEIGNVAAMIPLGHVVESKSQPAGDLAVEIELFKKGTLEYFDNGTGGNEIVLSTHFMKFAFWLNDHTLTHVANDGAGFFYACAGRIYDVDPLYGVGILPEQLPKAISDLIS